MSSLFSGGVSRRDFLKGGAATAAAAMLGTNPLFPAPAGAVEWAQALPDAPIAYKPDAVVLKSCCYYPNAGPIGNGIHWETFNFMERMLNGRIKFDRYWAGTLHSLGDGFKALRSGLSHFAQAYPLNNQGAFDLVAADGLPFIHKNNATFSATMETLAPKWFKREFEAQGIYMGLYPCFDVQAIVSPRPIRRMEDMKGLKLMGFGGSVLRETILALGGTPVFVSAPDTFIALQRGVVDGVVWALGSMVPWKFHEICKYVTVTGLALTGINYGLKKKSFDALPPDLREEFYYAMRLGTNHMSEGYVKLEETGDEDCRAAGMEVIRLDPEEKARWHRACEPVYASFMKKNKEKGYPVEEFMADLRNTAAMFNEMSLDELRDYTAAHPVHGIIDGL